MLQTIDFMLYIRGAL